MEHNIEKYIYFKTLPLKNMLSEEDSGILKELKKDSRLSTREIAKKIKSSAATVHRKLRNLIKEGYIKQFTYEPDWRKLGKNTSAYILINMDYPYVKRKKLSQDVIANRLKNHPFVFECDTVTGRKDIMIKVRVKDTDELNKFIIYLRNFEGIQQTETLVVLYHTPNCDNPFDKPYFDKTS